MTCIKTKLLSGFVLAFTCQLGFGVTLNILEWEGYISPYEKDIQAYAKSKGIDLKLNIVKPFITNPEQIFQVARRKGADLVTPTHNYYKTKNGQLFNVLLPIDTKKLENYSKILDSLRNADYDKKGNDKYSVPLLGGSYGLAYNLNKMSEAPKSWEVLWDKKYKGQFAITNDQFEANIYITLLVLGYPPASFYDIKKSNMKEAQVQSKLNELVANSGKFWAGWAEPAIMKDNVFVTTYWFGVAAANNEGQKWKLASPKEGQTVWLDTMALAEHLKNDASKLEAAYLVMNYMLTKKAQQKLFKDYGSVIVNTEAAKADGNDYTTFFKEEYFWQPLTARTRGIYKTMWEKAKDAAKK
ncbi:ABC transporter substrate-binding protein [Spartinivicinus ruber]|uniref:ABC transporter substrate-binding protein n=1 Tax=Spartinivicinus ruber TaxID=2683272 RepID=UPI0013D6B677|nr:extracellular solute-binding protein [Spartinivicinus ruber]